MLNRAAREHGMRQSIKHPRSAAFGRATDRFEQTPTKDKPPVSSGNQEFDRMKLRAQHFIEQLSKSVIEHIDFEAAVRKALSCDEPLRLIGELKKVTPGLDINHLVERLVEHAEPAFRKHVGATPKED